MYDEQGIPTCEDQSFSVPNYIIDACQKSLTKAEKANKNSLGKVLAIIRTLKAHDILVTES